MPRAKLSVTLPEGVWVRSVTEAYDETTLEVVSALTDDGVGTALLEVTSPHLPDVLEDISTADAVESVDLLRVVGDQALAQVETQEPLLLQTLEASRIPFDTPLVAEDGTVTLTVTATRDRISELGDQLELFGMSYELLYIHQSVDSTELLTEPQRQLLATAVESGYYDVPRECTLTELAEKEGIAKSSASERLHRAESKVITEWATGAFPTDSDVEPPETV
jgi:predicted DNA binding protein